MQGISQVLFFFKLGWGDKKTSHKSFESTAAAIIRAEKSISQKDDNKKKGLRIEKVICNWLSKHKIQRSWDIKKSQKINILKYDLEGVLEVKWKMVNVRVSS